MRVRKLTIPLIFIFLFLFNLANAYTPRIPDEQFIDNLGTGAWAFANAIMRYWPLMLLGFGVLVILRVLNL
jgi:hypothetical protein